MTKYRAFRTGFVPSRNELQSSYFQLPPNFSGNSNFTRLSVRIFIINFGEQRLSRVEKSSLKNSEGRSGNLDRGSSNQGVRRHSACKGGARDKSQGCDHSDGDNNSTKVSVP